MITNFKIFETNYSKYKDASKYEGKFFIEQCYMNEYEWKKESFYIVLVEEMLYKEYSADRYGEKHPIWPSGDSFTVMKNGKIKDPAGWGHSYSKEELDKINFMTPEEFYQQNPDLCEKLYWKIRDDYEKFKDDNSSWYSKTIKLYKKTLETISAFKHFENSEKYNL